MKKEISIFLFLFFFIAVNQAYGNDIETRLQILEEALKKQEETIKEQQKIIGELKAQIKTVPAVALENKDVPFGLIRVLDG